MTVMENLKDTISNILEKMFFLIEETPPDNFEKKYDFGTYIACDFFKIEICFTEPLAKEITANFLGIAEDPDTEDILDCLKEITNMISGNLIGKMYPENDKRIPIPESYKCDKKTGKLTAAESSVMFYSVQPMELRFSPHNA